MARVYATPVDLIDGDWVDGPLPADADRLLARASLHVDGLLLAAVYDVDDQGLPTDPKVGQALKDATCAQAAYWDETGDDSGAAGQWASASLGSASYTRARGKTGAASRTAPQAVEVLQVAGILPADATVYV